jgi:hypothetical protein
LWEFEAGPGQVTRLQIATALNDADHGKTLTGIPF